VADLANTHRRSVVYRDHHDTLTGLANRAFFAKQLPVDTSGDTAAVLLIDLDEFKVVNETLGHSFGDTVLVTVARRIARCLGRQDLGARFGGDEFAILVASATTTADVRAMAARVAAAVAEPVAFAGREVRVTASIGVAMAGSGAAEASGDDSLLSRAGLALQAARAEGPGRWCTYEHEIHGPMIKRMYLRSELAVAVAQRSFTLQYQPIVALDTTTTVGLEALLRWNHPTLGRVPPDDFIDVAEETGLIEEIGEWVLRRAVAAAAHWHRTDPPGPYVSVNVSARQFRTSGFADRVHEILAAAALPPSHLMLELTESVLLRDDEDEVWAELAALSETGVRLALDDFGTGFSSMTYLLQTPFDVIKIDRTFVTTLATSARHRAIVELIVHLAQRLSLHVVAEGIETPANRDLLAEIGCPYGQGYLYSVPLTNSEANRWLAAESGPPLDASCLS
jgi:diguanylate cyclase (GGDEF)-like protein